MKKRMSGLRATGVRATAAARKVSRTIFQNRLNVPVTPVNKLKL
jgi:hypothetical protein